jgi:hypothetical protein
MNCSLHRYNSDDIIREEETGRSCGTYGKEKCIQVLGGET